MGKELSEMTLEELWEPFPIILKEHNTNYKNWYETEKQKLLSCIDRKNIMRINHIGSSAVEGLIAKPTVDILLEIDKESNIEQLTDKLLQNGWGLMSSENKPCMKILFSKGYTKEGFSEKVYHLHVRYYDNWNELYFRDYLMEHEEVSKEYGKLNPGLFMNSNFVGIFVKNLIEFEFVHFLGSKFSAIGRNISENH